MPTPKHTDSSIDVDAIQRDIDGATELGNQLRIIDREFNSMNQYNREVVIERARFHSVNATASLLQLGECLILLKEHEVRVDYLASLEQINITEGYAQKIRKATVKFSSGARAKLVDKVAPGKLFDLLGVDDDELDQLADDGTYADIHLDEIDKMSQRELREALRKARADKADQEAVTEKILNDKDNKLNQLDAELKHREGLDGLELAENLLKEMMAHVSSVEAMLCMIARCQRDIAQSFENETPKLVSERVDLFLVSIRRKLFEQFPDLQHIAEPGAEHSWVTDLLDESDRA